MPSPARGVSFVPAAAPPSPPPTHPRRPSAPRPPAAPPCPSANAPPTRPVPSAPPRAAATARPAPHALPRPAPVPPRAPAPAPAPAAMAPTLRPLCPAPPPLRSTRRLQTASGCSEFRSLRRVGSNCSAPQKLRGESERSGRGGREGLPAGWEAVLRSMHIILQFTRRGMRGGMLGLGGGWPRHLPPRLAGVHYGGALSEDGDAERGAGGRGTGRMRA